MAQNMNLVSSASPDDPSPRPAPPAADAFPETTRIQRIRLLKQIGLYPFFVPSSGQVGPRMLMDGHDTIMLGSNNYMGLANHPEMIQAAVEATRKYGTSCTGSRFLNGTLDIHNELEEKLSAFFGKDAAICFSTGMQANLGVISGITDKDDHIVSDEKNHASIIDGCRLSYAKTHVYKHDDMESLRRTLRALPKNGLRWIVSDGVFSMEGSVANIPEIVALAKEFNARIIIDDAHGIGYMGDHGEGCCGHFNLMDHIDILTGTFSKSFASLGGFCAGRADLMDHLKHHARSLIFSASMPPAMVACAITALDLFQREKQLRKQVMVNASYLRIGVQTLGFRTVAHSIPTAIVPIMVGENLATYKLHKTLLACGVYTNPVVPPASAEGLLRLSVMATHTEDDLTDALNILHRVGREAGLI
ncbi:MAG TPA: pyridoxal phosphate-dependent aminotransferase family protein [Smithellaceae bacterium]|nr:pyridoxal phosphate-dependent aminotransferase family protein [Smithellaceae bacterium]HOQ71587.1 pyridoxal phosphate-dependent aminotransferase family protein [Smithellaceae bacterium]